ncbi:MAG TPA: FecR family protein, partial [Vicinamibacterales bacterium]|nr:FecR family protein [Vicinamibacterales bacterium]
MVRPLVSRRALRSISFGLVALACVLPVHAQAVDVPPSGAEAPAHISFVDGVAILERDGRTDDAPGSMPLLAGDRVRTRAGRVEILFADGSTLHLDHNSGIDLQSDELVRLLEGRIRLSIPGPARSVAYRIDGPHGWAHIAEPGDYRVALMNGAGGSELELAVIRGRAELVNDAGETALRAGERAFVRAGAAPSYAYVANSAALDAFDRWSEARRDERLAASAEYLPDEVRPYAASFERHGYWGDEPTYGRVWYPRVAPDWRPYYRGRWVNLRPYGWTWVAHDPWGWPTHHYGRWGFSHAGAWFWIPGRTWGAAWVSWAYAPGYISWCPLGWNNRPVFQININVGRRYDPWRAWTVIPQRHFGYGFVHRNVVRAGFLDRRTLGSFTHRDRGPEIRGYAVPRGSAPIRVAGTAGSRRGPSPLYTNLPADQGRVRTDGARINVRGGSPAAAPP